MTTGRVGQRFGNYRLIRLLGSGGFADVYLGEHIHLSSYSAIKVLYTRLADDEVQRFRSEARTIAQLKHPNIVRLLDFGVENDTPFLVMDYAPNGNLRQRHSRGLALPLETILPYVRQVASALQYAHDRKLIHRDVKPQNMLVGLDNEILLGDFGVALIAQSSLEQPVVGTPSYMAPEQIRGKPLPASDQYSLGVIVYEWLSGTLPFSGSFVELASQHIQVPPPPLRAKNPSLSPDVENVVMTALAKDPKDRFGSVQAFATALEQAYLFASNYPTVLSPLNIYPNQSPSSSGGITPSPSTPQLGSSPYAPSPSYTHTSPDVQQPAYGYAPPSLSRLTETSFQQVQAPPQEAPHPLKRGISRRAVLVGLVGLTGLAAAEVAASGGLTWQKLFQRPQTPTPTPALGTTLYTYPNHADIVDAVAWSPDGRRIASGSYDQTVQVWDATDGGHAFTYLQHSGIVTALAWSPDGKRIASGSADHTVQVWDAADGGHAFTYRGHSGPVNAVVWSPSNGRRIASGSSDKTVKVWDAAGGGHAFIYRGHTDIVSALAWSPDGKRIASASNDQTVQVWDAADGGNVFTYQGHSDTVDTVAWSPDAKRIASGSADHTVQVWDAADGGHAFIYHGHSDVVTAVAWSPDGKYIASGSLDGTVQIWDATTGKLVSFYRGDSSRVFALAWSPDGKSIASGSASKMVRVWLAA